MSDSIGDGCPRATTKEARISKSGVVATQVEAVGKHGRHRLTKRRYVATFGPFDELGTLTYAAWELQATEAKSRVFLGDRVDWIKTQASEHFPDALQILDWPHLQRKIHTALRVLHPGQQAARRAWRKQYEVLFPLLWQANVSKRWPTCRACAPPMENLLRPLKTRYGICTPKAIGSETIRPGKSKAIQ